MNIVKIRRVGNSSVVTIPGSVAGDDFPVGSQVVVHRNDRGEIVITPAERVREQVLEAGRRIAAHRAEALEILADHDPDAVRH
jgi:antitoxin component of MazEF toxin-antitoxin module